MTKINTLSVTAKRNERLKELANDPAFNKPISHLKKEYTGTLTLVTRIKIYK
jgi:hypothetical protein